MSRATTTSDVSKMLEEKFGKGSGLGADYHLVHEEMRPEIEHQNAIRILEREVIDAAIKYTQIFGYKGGALEGYITERDAAYDELESAVGRLLKEREG